MTKKNYIIITSIFPPTEAIEKFAARNDYKLVVVGDKKTPADWSYDGVDFLSTEDQESLGYKLASTLPYNHYCRKMVGYLYAMQKGAESMVDTDDDNIPKDTWHFPPLSGSFDSVEGEEGFVNIYQLYTQQKIWARGLPLHLINHDFDLENKITSSDHSNIGMWQGLADEDPDVDAIYRLVSDTPCYFDHREPVVLREGTYSPFNTQNTLVRQECYPLMYLPSYVTFRFTDILRSYVAQPIMWLYDYRLGFTNATVVQKRNPHDYMADFNSEIPMYQQCMQVIETINKSISANNTMGDNLYNTYDALCKADIVPPEEMKTLSAWLEDIQKLQNM